MTKAQKSISKLEDQKVETDKISGGKKSGIIDTSNVSVQAEDDTSSLSSVLAKKVTKPVIRKENPDARYKTVIKAERNSFND